jgi:tetratricopeptide (TPR) repeat protein
VRARIDIPGRLDSTLAAVGEESNVKPGRNAPCPCGSGNKFKACCGRLAATGEAQARSELAGPDDVPRTELEPLLGLMDAGHFVELEGAARALLGTRPRSGLVWQLLGISLGRQGKDALPALSAAARHLPQDAPAHLNLGNALGRAGRLAEAAESFRRALALQPDFAEAHSNLSDVQLELGQLAEAINSARRAVEIRPAFAAAQQNLGRALLRLGRYAEAVDSCRRAIQLRPDFAEAHNSLGSALAKLGRPEEAIAGFRRAVAISPGFAEAHANLANAVRATGNLGEAVEGYRRAILLKPDFVSALIELATALRLQRRTAESEATCNAALRIAPDSAPAFAVLAELRADNGHFAEAEDYFKRAVACDPESVEAWAGLARVRRMTPSDAAWTSAVQALVERGLPLQREMTLRYALGKYFDDVQDFPNAFLNYQRANELASQCAPAHDRAGLSRTIDLIIHSHSREWLTNLRPAANPSRRPVFIVGMLRSGTTLAEQILASHPAVLGAGELTFWTTELAALTAATGDAPRIRLDDARLAILGTDYLRVLENLSHAAARVVDKLPTNFLALGLIRCAFPNARIIHMRRNPVATCLSIYFQHFEAANTYANDLGHLAHYHREYQRLMDHWRTILPTSAMLEVPYEELVGKPQEWSRRMVEFLDLPWDPRCLEFHRTARTVVTASKWQVRQAIDPASVQRWRHYENFVGPLLSLLPEASH